jgi:ABC-type amino acid transport substrate-binding protein
VVFDAPLLGYLIKTQQQGKTRLLAQTLQRQDYVIALPPDSPLREPLNESVLQQVNSPEWQAKLRKVASLGR